MALAGLLIYFEVPLLGRSLSAKAQKELETRRQEFVAALGGQIPGPLLLSAVAPKTHLLYLESLARFFLGRSQDGSPPPTTIVELDDSLGKWIQRSYDRWIGVCYAGGVDIGAAVISAGHALDCRRYSGGRYRHLETPAAKSRIKRARYCN